MAYRSFTRNSSNLELRCFKNLIIKRTFTKAQKPSHVVTSLVPLLEVKEEKGAKYVPITRKTLIRQIISYDILTPKEKLILEDFTSGLDATVSRSFKPELLYLKNKYEILNPDRNIRWVTKQLEEKKRNENQFWFLQRLSAVMAKAHFIKLSKEEVAYALSEHERGGIKVSVDLTQYSTLQFWALGRRSPGPSRMKTLRRWKDNFMGLFTGIPAGEESDYYDRVVVAFRRKRDAVLYLKAFKDVPVVSIEQLLPNGKIRMGKWDKYMLFGSVSFGGISLMVRSLANADKIGNINVSWIFGGISAFILYQGISQYINRRNTYLLKISQMLYYKSIANNRGLITLLVDRAEDEFFKEILLIYITLLTNRPQFYVPGELPGHISAQNPNEPLESIGIPVDILPPPSPMTQQEIDSSVESLLKKMTKKENIIFESASALKLMVSLNMITSENDHFTDSIQYKAEPLHTVVEKLPRFEIVSERTEEFEVEEEEERSKEEKDMVISENTFKNKIMDPSSSIQSMVKAISDKKDAMFDKNPEFPDWGKTDIRIPVILRETTIEVLSVLRKRYDQWKKSK